MIDKKKLAALFAQQGYTDFRWIKGSEVTIAHWVRFKCIFGCPSYGKRGSCPPEVPTVEECKKFFKEFSNVAIFRFKQALGNPKERCQWSQDINKKLLALERAVFLEGFHKVFLLFMDECRLCIDCSSKRAMCNQPADSRPSPEGFGVDLFTTVKQCGYPISVLQDYNQTMNRYAFLLIS